MPSSTAFITVLDCDRFSRFIRLFLNFGYPVWFSSRVFFSDGCVKSVQSAVKKGSGARGWGNFSVSITPQACHSGLTGNTESFSPTTPKVSSFWTKWRISYWDIKKRAKTRFRVLQSITFLRSGTTMSWPYNAPQKRHCEDVRRLPNDVAIQKAPSFRLDRNLTAQSQSGIQTGRPQGSPLRTPMSLPRRRESRGFPPQAISDCLICVISFYRFLSAVLRNDSLAIIAILAIKIHSRLNGLSG